MSKESSQMVASPEVVQPVFKVQDRCRICASKRLVPVFDLGQMCIGAALDREGESNNEVAPLDMVRCNECSLVQLAHSVDAELLRSAGNAAVASSDATHAHVRNLIDQAIEKSGSCPGDRVIDLSCRDGSAEPPSPTDVSGVRKAKVITSIGTFANVNDPLAYVEDIEAALDPKGIWVLELSYLPAMLRAVSFDSISHDRVAYYRLRTFERLLGDTNLELFDVEFNDWAGGSMRLYVAPSGSRTPAGRLVVARAEEANGLFDTRYPYEGFQTNVFRAKEAFLRFFSEAKTAGKSVYGYGVSSNGLVLLQYCGMKSNQMIAIADHNQDKIGRRTPGSGIAICAKSEMRMANPDYLVVLPGQNIKKVLEREAGYLHSGGCIIAVLPEMRMYTASDVYP